MGHDLYLMYGLQTEQLKFCFTLWCFFFHCFTSGVATCMIINVYSFPLFGQTM